LHGIPITQIRQAGFENYYRNNVIGSWRLRHGGARFQSFGQAIVKKMTPRWLRPSRCAGAAR
jgi:hypothetical protein